MTTIWPAISAAASRHDAWLCDIWGVLHNGVAAYPKAADACAAFRRQGGRVILVSNAPRPAAAVAAQLADMGISDASYDSILTSGDVTRALLARMDPVPLFLLGPERHRVLTDGLANPFVAEADAAMVLCSGLYEMADDDHPEMYRAQLQRLAKRNLRMICANPDLSAQAGDVIRYAAGSLAAIYEGLGGNVIYAGKPHAAVYAEARARLAKLAGREVDVSRILAIGDGINTDIRGAASAGIDALYIASPIHLDEPFSRDAVARLFAAHTFKPIAAMRALVW
jgi:HAD superfamily hydrolase (TIGR01459 family)